MPEDGHDRDQRVAQRVARDDDLLGEALGAGGADVVGAQHVDHRRADEAREDRQVRDGDRRDRQDQVVQRS